MGTAVRPAMQDIPGPWDAFGDVDILSFVDEGAGGAHGDAARDGTRPQRSGAQAAAGRSDIAAQGDDGDLVCLFFAVCRWRANGQLLRYLLQHALWIIRPLDRPGLWRRLLDRAAPQPGGAPAGVIQPESSAVVIDSHRSCRSAPELLCARHRWRQEDPRRQDPDGR